MAPVQLWLFEDPPVTLDEIAAWAQEHARIAPDNWRYSYYVNGWDVAGKIRAAKISALARTADRAGGKIIPAEIANNDFTGC